LSEGLETSVGREARQLMAADLAIESRRPLPQELDERLRRELGGDRATIKEMATVVRVDRAASAGRGGLESAQPSSQLVELKAIGRGYPFYGTVEIEPARPLEELLEADTTIVAPDLLERLGLAPGDHIRIGVADFVIAGVVRSEPDRVGMALTAGPRVIVSLDGLDRADLERFGSRISYRTLVRLPAETDRATLTDLAESIREWDEVGPEQRISTYTEAQPAVGQALGRVDRFLGLVALLSLLLGGVGVAQTTRAWLESRTDAMAILRSLGFRPNEVFRLYWLQAFALGLVGSVLGVAVGTGILALVPRWIADLLPQGLGVSPWQPLAALRGLGLGVGTALLFSFAPLAAVRRIPPLRVLRKDIEPIRATKWVSCSLASSVPQPFKLAR